MFRHFFVMYQLTQQMLCYLYFHWTHMNIHKKWHQIRSNNFRALVRLQTYNTHNRGSLLEWKRSRKKKKRRRQQCSRYGKSANPVLISIACYGQPFLVLGEDPCPRMGHKKGFKRRYEILIIIIIFFLIIILSTLPCLSIISWVVTNRMANYLITIIFYRNRQFKPSTCNINSYVLNNTVNK